jgi:hypothetical protein
MNSETLARWLKRLEDVRIREAVDEDGDAFEYMSPDDLDALREEIRSAWVEAVRKECA